MMDLPQLAEFSFLSSLAKKNIQQFIDEADGIRHVNDIYNLLKIYHFIQLNDECWREDIVATMNEKRNWSKTIKIANNNMAGRRLIRVVATDPVRGEKYEITNKGAFVIDQYMSWLREEERKVFYAIKLNRRKAKEHKEK